MKKLLLLLTLVFSSAYLFAQDCDGQPAPAITLVSSINCNEGSSNSITTTVSEGTPPYTYTWSTGEMTSAISGLSVGNYTVTVTDANGCIAIGNDSITDMESSIELDFSYNADIFVSCYGGSDAQISITTWHAVQPVTYLWNTGDTQEDIYNLAAGVYTLVATDANGCAAVITAEVFEPDELELIPTSFPSSGDDGVAAVNVQGGTPPYNYVWSTSDSTQIADGLAAGTYSVTVTDNNDCTISGSVTVDMYTNTVNLDNLTQFEVSPNPSDGQFRIDAHFDTYQEFDIFVLNTLGQAVTEIHVAGEMLTVPIDIRDQNEGTYFIVIQTDRGQAVRKYLMNK